jgi:hypothetical protein
MVLPLLEERAGVRTSVKTNFRWIDSLAPPGGERLASRCKTTNLPP